MVVPLCYPNMNDIDHDQWAGSRQLFLQILLPSMNYLKLNMKCTLKLVGFSLQRCNAGRGSQTNSLIPRPSRGLEASRGQTRGGALLLYGVALHANCNTSSSTFMPMFLPLPLTLLEVQPCHLLAPQYCFPSPGGCVAKTDQGSFGCATPQVEPVDFSLILPPHVNN